MIAFESTADHLQSRYRDMRFCLCDLDLGPMTFIYELYLGLYKCHYYYYYYYY